MKLSCHLCDKDFSWWATFRNHIWVHISHQIVHRCSTCGNFFDSDASLRKHRAQHSEAEKSQPCKLCGKECESRNALAEHRLEHKMERVSANKTPTGDRSPMTIATAEHKAQKTEIEKYQLCKLCGERFETKEMIAEHRLIHKVEKVTAKNRPIQEKSSLSKAAHEQEKKIPSAEEAIREVHV